MAGRRWRCTVCGYIHMGEDPPAFCPECGAPASFFEEVKAGEESPGLPASTSPGKGLLPRDLRTLDAEARKAVEPALFKISYGLYLVGATAGGRANAQCCNTLVQLTSDPLRVAIGINRQNFTHGLIVASGAFSVGVLGKDGHRLVRRFGFQSGHRTDKMAGVAYRAGHTGAPLIEGCLAYFEARVLPEKCVDAGTHTLFLGEVVGGQVVRDEEPMTYAYYRETKHLALEG